MNNPDPAAGSTASSPVFTGSSKEYFRIWVVNMLLSIITLGTYSAWATVRNRRYLYGNVELDGSRFDFHGQPLAILRGRILAVIAIEAHGLISVFESERTRLTRISGDRARCRYPHA